MLQTPYPANRIQPGLVIILLCVGELLATPLRIQSKVDVNSKTPADARTSYTSIMNDLRDNWQSPIMYLKKRGYLPIFTGNDMLAETGRAASYLNVHGNGNMKDIILDSLAGTASNGL